MSDPVRPYRVCVMCEGEKRTGGTTCWLCSGRGYLIHGRCLAEFSPGDRVVDAYTRAEWEVVRHTRKGTTVMRSTATGRELEMNSTANLRYISVADADAPGVWDVQPLEAR